MSDVAPRDLNLQRPVAVIAFGGNALAPNGSEDEAAQFAEAQRFAATIVPLLANYRILLVYGNGPQVGRLLLQSESAARETAPWSLAACGAASQGVIGYMLERALRAALAKGSFGLGGAGILPDGGQNAHPTLAQIPIASLMTLVEVDPRDPAFGDPSKPIGPYYEDERAKALGSQRGFSMKRTGSRWRRVAPSPRPIRVFGDQVVKALLDGGALVLAGGGGGVPVIRRDESGLEGVDAVIDKDLTAVLFAKQISAEWLVILTNVNHVERDFGTPQAKRLERLSVVQAMELLAANQFPAGSMGPKIEAAADFVNGTSRKAVITSVRALGEAMRGEAGTWVEA